MPLLSEICTQSDPPPSKNAIFDRFFTYNVTAARYSEQSSVMTYKPQAFQRAIDGVRYL